MNNKHPTENIRNREELWKTNHVFQYLFSDPAVLLTREYFQATLCLFFLTQPSKD